MIVNIKDKIRIGTVQFGLNYGIVNESNLIISDEDLLELFDVAIDLGFFKFDTANEYGSVNQRLNKLRCQREFHNLSIQNKVIFRGEKDITTWFDVSLKKSQDLLGNIDSLLIHNGFEISKDTVEKLLKIKNCYHCDIGLSIYSPDQFFDYLDDEKIVIQIPFNVANHIVMKPSSGVKVKCKVQARSIFLQGLLLTNLNKIPQKFDQYITYFKEYERYVKSHGMSKLEFNLAFVLGQKWINELVVGVQNIEQLRILNSTLEKITNLDYHFDFGKLFPNEPNLIDPRLW